MGWNPVVPSHTLSEALLPSDCGHFFDMMPSIWVVQGPRGLPEAPLRDNVSGTVCPGILARKYVYIPGLLPILPIISGDPCRY